MVSLRRILVQVVVEHQPTICILRKLIIPLHLRIALRPLHAPLDLLAQLLIDVLDPRLRDDRGELLGVGALLFLQIGGGLVGVFGFLVEL